MPKVNARIQMGKYEEILAAVQSPVITITELIKNASDSCINAAEPIFVRIDTKNNIITIEDSGEGFREEDLIDLAVAGFSKKMKEGRYCTQSGIPYAGNKGLGILTAFFLADTLEIITTSLEEQKSYRVYWEKGSQEYEYSVINRSESGTKVTLYNVDPEKLKLILLPEEKVKIFMASLKFYDSRKPIPKIRLFIDEKEEKYYPVESLDVLYTNNKGEKNGFVAKASFEYSDNILTLSYEDNISGYYTFSKHKINMVDVNSIDKFINEIQIPISIGTKLKESDLLKEPFISINVPKFNGVFYIWRGRKNTDISKWPYGVRIYVNNYSLYRYLDQENDWLTLSEISQNVKATNYKMKNTYGYLDFNDYNENEAELKISKERNDFIDSMAQRKFIRILRDFVVEIFTRIDIAVKNAPDKSFTVRETNITIKSKQSLDLKRLIICNNISINDLQLNYDKSKLHINDDWVLTSEEIGEHVINLEYNNIKRTLTIIVKKQIPYFNLTKDKISLNEGNTINLRDYIEPSSCIDISLNEIQIKAKNDTTIIKDDLFSKDNSIGQHIVLYYYGETQKTLEINVKPIEKHPGFGGRSPRIDALFPKIDALRNSAFKITELIDGISANYIQCPTLCMAVIRVLLEASTNAFFEKLSSEQLDISLDGLINKVMNISECNEANPDYVKYISNKDQEFITNFKTISREYAAIFSKDVKKNIKTHYKEIDLNMFIHSSGAITTDRTVFQTMRIFSPLLNYIFEILLLP